MEHDANTATALLSALRLAREHGGAVAALEAGGIELPDPARFQGLASELGELVRSGGEVVSVPEALALGFLAGRVAPGPRPRTASDPTSFLMDRDLICQGAEGESILRLPWFDESLFVGRHIPEIAEMPVHVRTACVENYSAALAGERGRFEFESHGHAYSVEAVPVVGEDRRVEAVLGIATPAGCFAAAARAYERTACGLDQFAEGADRRADLHAVAGRTDEESAERHAAGRARGRAQRARAHAESLRGRDAPGRVAAPPVLTPREAEVLRLASHGLTYAEIAGQLAVSVATVRTHLEHVYPKLGVNDKAAAVAAALRHGLID